MDKLSYLPATTDEQIATCAALAHEIWHECFADILQPEQIDYMVENLQSAGPMTRQIREEGYEYFLVGAGAAAGPVGYIAIHAVGGRLLLSKLYLLAAQRGKGFGRTLMDFVEAAGLQRSCNTVWLTVNRHNKRAIAVYEKTGFECVREQVMDIGGGWVMDDFIFEKPLNDWRN